jgi:hypothetical protein
MSWSFLVYFVVGLNFISVISAQGMLLLRTLVTFPVPNQIKAPTLKQVVQAGQDFEILVSLDLARK